MIKLAACSVLCLAVLAMGSCQKNAVEEVSGVPTVTINLGLETVTKTYMGAKTSTGYPVLWSASDLVSINGKCFMVPDSSVGKKSAQFEGVPAAAEYTMVYPGQLYDMMSGDISLPTYQRFTVSSFCSNIAVMAVRGASTDQNMYNLCGFLRFRVPAESKNIVLRTLGGEPISGRFHISFPDSSAPVMTSEAGEDVIHIDENTTYNDDVGYMVVSIPAGTYSKGFGIYLTEDGVRYVGAKTLVSGIDIKAGTVYQLSDLTFGHCSDMSFAKVINTADDLADFLSEASSFGETDEAVFGGDIDLSLLSPGKSLVTASSFRGTLDGCGFALKNWNSAQSLIRENKGKIRNIVIDSSCRFSYGTPEAVDAYYGIIAEQSSGEISGIINHAPIQWNNSGNDLGYRVWAGTIVGYAKGGKISNCINDGKITLTPPNITNEVTSATCTQYFGGLVGRMSDTQLENCVNDGDFSLEIGKARHAVSMGGIVASAYGTGKIASCENNGKITFRASSTATGGGVVVGGVAAQSTVETESCVNRGDIELIGTGYVKCPHVGGVVSYASGKVTSCLNYGNITASMPYVTYGFFVSTLAASSASGAAAGFVTPTFGGVVGCNCKCDVKECENRGNLTVTFSEYASAATGWPCVGGVVGTPGGKSLISQCRNYGDLTLNSVNPASPRANVSAGRQQFMGGITASCLPYTVTIDGAEANVYSMANGFASIASCENHGTVTFNSDYNTANHYIGGIIGMGDQEAEGVRMTVTSCLNTGKIQGLGFTKCRLGGIVGANATVEGCRNEGDIYAGPNTLANCQLGGILGFLRYHTITDNVTTGNVRSEGTATAWCGGIIGQSSSGQGSIQGGSVDCTVSATNAPDSSSSGIGIIAGWTTSSTSAPFRYGTSAKPITVAGKVVDSNSEKPVTQFNYDKLNIGGRSVLFGRSDSDRGISCSTVFGGTPIETGIKGYVKDENGNPWADVVMSDGFSVTRTDSKGYYELEPVQDTWYVYYSLPEDAEVTTGSAGQPLFYQKYSRDVNRYDFTIKRLKSGAEKSFTLFCLADPQARAGTMANRFRDETVPAIYATRQKLTTPCYGVTLGDVVYSEGSANTNANMPTMQGHMSASKIGMPIFQTMGNHDYTYFYGSSKPISADETSSTYDLKAQRCFEDCFGPINYSWNRGDVHIVCMRNIMYKSTTDASNYAGGFTNAQYEWLKQDLKYVPTTKMVILCVHIPIVGITSNSNVTNVLNLMKQYKNPQIMSGHTHYMRNAVSVSSTGIYEHVHAAICGAWWHSNLNGDGCPNGYGIYEINGTTIRDGYYLGTNTGMNARDYQIRLYRGNSVYGGKYEYFQWQLGSSVLLANVFNADSAWKIQVYENGALSGTMSLIANKKYGNDNLPYTEGKTTMIPTDSSQDWWAIGFNVGVVGRGHSAGNRNSYMTACMHLYKYTLKNPSATVKVVATDRYGTKYECSEIMKDKEYPPYAAKGNH